MHLLNLLADAALFVAGEAGLTLARSSHQARSVPFCWRSRCTYFTRRKARIICIKLRILTLCLSTGKPSEVDGDYGTQRTVWHSDVVGIPTTSAAECMRDSSVFTRWSKVIQRSD